MNLQAIAMRLHTYAMLTCKDSHRHIGNLTGSWCLCIFPAKHLQSVFQSPVSDKELSQVQLTARVIKSAASQAELILEKDS